MDILTETIKEVTVETNIDFIAAVKTTFLGGHEMFSADPYVDSFLTSKNAAHSNEKGYAKSDQVVADYIASQQ